MRRRLIVSYLALAAVVLIILEVPLGILGVRRENDQLSAQAQRDGTALAVVAKDSFEHPGRQDLTALVSRYQGATGAEVSIVDASGHTVAKVDPNETPEPEDAVATLARQALTGKTATRARVLDENKPVLASAMPTRIGTGSLVGAVVVFVPAGAAEHRIHLLIGGLGILAASVLGVTALVGFLLARSVTEPLGELTDTAKRLGKGELSARAATAGPPEVRALAGSFNEMAARLEELMAAQRHFVADASHQLRSPLTALRLRLENLQVTATPALAADLDAASGEVIRLSRLVDGLLALTRAEGSRPERQVIDVAQVVEDRREAWSALAEERNVQLAVDRAGPAGGALAHVVPGHLDQILDNLLANALDVTPAGKAIRLRIEPDGAHVSAHVEDEGPGMTAEERGRAFDRFWQGSTRTNGSSGLGLAIVQQLAHLNGGDVILNPSAGGGLDASVILERATPGDQAT